MVFLRGFIIWLILILAESLHGTARTLWLAPRIGDLPARQISLITGSILIVMITTLFVRWLHASGISQLISVGILWMLFTVGFEIGLGRLLGYSWERIWSDYNLLKGGLMPLGLVLLAFSPLIAARLRGVLPHLQDLSS